MVTMRLARRRGSQESLDRILYTHTFPHAPAPPTDRTHSSLIQARPSSASNSFAPALRGKLEGDDGGSILRTETRRWLQREMGYVRQGDDPWLIGRGLSRGRRTEYPRLYLGNTRSRHGRCRRWRKQKPDR